VFKVLSFGLHKGPESFSPLVDGFVNIRLFKVSPQRPHICCLAMETAGGSQQR